MTHPMTPEQIAEGRALVAKATQTPWGPVNPVEAWVEVPDRDAPICAMLWPTDLRSEDETFANARLLIAAVNAYPAYLDLCERVGRLEEALRESHDAIAEYYRYWTGGEMRGSYDGKPERAGLWKAQQKARAALKETRHG